MIVHFETIDMKDAPNAYSNVTINFNARLQKFPSAVGGKDTSSFVLLTTTKGTEIWIDWHIVTSFILK